MLATVTLIAGASFVNLLRRFTQSVSASQIRKFGDLYVTPVLIAAAALVDIVGVLGIVAVKTQQE
jgi:hypothetical protein